MLGWYRLFKSLPAWARRTIIGLFALLVIISALGLYGLAHNQNETLGAISAATPTNSAITAPASPSTTTTQKLSPARGCLGGEDSGQAVFTAQKQAAHTPEGAAEFAAAYTRWVAEYPHVGDPKQQGKALWASDATDYVRQAGQWPSTMQVSGMYASFLHSRYKVDAYTSASATVTVSYTLVGSSTTGDEQDDTASTAKLSWTSTGWRVQDSVETPLETPAQLDSSGTAFTGGC